MKLAVLICALAQAHALGGMKAIFEVGPSSRVHRLASFTVEALQAECAASNSFACSRLVGASLARVTAARSQTVAGRNYEIEFETDTGDAVTIAIFEQSWTSTLTLSSVSVGGYGSALHDELALDWNAFDAYSTTAVCSNGQVWNDCGSPCVKTCGQPAPMCVAVCEARCECPRDKPVFEGGVCISLADCPARLSTPVKLHQSEVQPPPCVPDPLARCTREYNPVCAAGKTYSNPCMAKAACHEEDSVPGRCPDKAAEPAAEPAPDAAAASKAAAAGVWGSMMVGGVPIGGGGGTLGGHYAAPADKGEEDQGHIVGGYAAQPAEVHAEGTKIHKLADFSIRALAASGAAGMKAATFVRVASAQTQVVAGLNYRLECETSAGVISLVVFEQVWSKTLVITRATAADGTALISAELPLDSAAFDAYTSPSPLRSGVALVARSAASTPFMLMGVSCLLLFAVSGALVARRVVAVRLSSVVVETAPLRNAPPSDGKEGSAVDAAKL